MDRLSAARRLPGRFTRSRRYGGYLLAGMLMALCAVPAAQAQEAVAYVRAEAPDGGVLGDPATPFATLASALASGASELRVAPGVYAGDLHLTGGAWTLRTWAADAASPVEFRGTLRLDGGATLTLADGPATVRLDGDLLLYDGVLDLGANTLEVRGRQVFVGHPDALRSTGQCGGGVRFSGSVNTDLFFDSSGAALVFTHPSIEVQKDGGAKVTFNANGIPSTSPNPDSPNNVDTLQMTCLTLESGGVEMLDGLDLLDVGLDYEQRDGEFLMSGVSSIGPAPALPTRQTLRTGADFIEDDGEFFTSGGDVEVFGDFLLGEDRGTAPGDALFSLEFNGVHSVVGDFRVGPDENPDERTEDVDGDGDVDFDPDERNRYFLGNGRLDLFGDYFFFGTGDAFDDAAFLQEEQGLRGRVFFVGNSQQTVWHRQDEDAFFCDVVMAGEGGTRLEANAWQSECGTLLLELGVIDTNDEQFDWIILNPGFEDRLVERNNAERGRGVVQLGSRDSYFNGEVDRRVEFSNAAGGVVTGGYLFPVGATGDERDPGTGTPREVDFFRPLILQFPDDLGRTSLARVDYRQDLTRDVVAFDELVVDAVDGWTLTLDVLSDQFWLLEFDQIPAFDPNIRVEAPGLPNIFDIKSLRLIQWDCVEDGQGVVVGGVNPRLAGVYDLDPGDPLDDPSAVLNDFINGVPNLTQEGVMVEGCNLIGIASNFFINALDADPQELSPLQILQAAPSEVDVYVDGRRVLDDLGFGAGTPFGGLTQGGHTLAVVDGAAPDAGNPLASLPLSADEDPVIFLIASGDGDPALLLLEGARQGAVAAGTVDVIVAHARPPADGTLSVALVDAAGQVAADLGSLDPGTFGAYQTVTPQVYFVTVADASGSVLGVFEIDLSAQADAALTLVLAEAPGGKQQGLTLLVFGADGRPLPLDDVTATDPAEALPRTFALHGNYPNPFNPATTVVFDLPEAARVHVEVFDLMGRRVLTTATRRVEAGAGRTLALDAGVLASGTYLYRVVARGPVRGWTATGRIVLVK